VPDLRRQKLHSDSESDLVSAWQFAPAALAVVGPEGVSVWNDACRSLLRETVGDSESAGRRWLSAAATRLLASGRHRDVVSFGRNDLVLAVCLGPALPAGNAHVVSLDRTTGADSGRESLAETVSTLSHELRTPLTSMKSSLDLVLAGEAGTVSDDQSHFLGMTLRNINRLERLVSDLLDVSRREEGQPTRAQQETDLGPVLREAVQMQATAAAQAGLELDSSALPPTLAAHIDPDKMVQILANIVGNAIKYTPAGGLVRVGVESRIRHQPDTEPGLAYRFAKHLGLPLRTFCLVVADSGPGLSRTDQERIFEPWYRVSRDETGGVPGAGLGLSITRALVESHGGWIRMDSEPGSGTTVRVDLPRDPASEKLLLAARRLQSLLTKDPARELVVLDGRDSEYTQSWPLAEMVTEFQRQRPDLTDQTAISLADNVMVVVVDEEMIWGEAWREFAMGRGQVDPPRWRPAEWIKSQLGGLRAETLSQ